MSSSSKTNDRKGDEGNPMKTSFNPWSADPAEARDSRRGFYLVQRISRSWRADKTEAEIAKAGPLGKLSNPFGYGTLGDYDLDYMGSAEFEWGAIPAALDRLAAAKKDIDLSIGERSYGGRLLDFLWIGKEGDPWDAFCQWAEGNEHDRPFCGKERPYGFERLLEDPTYEYGGQVWWALNANVMWAFHDGDDGHLLRMLRSIDPETTRLRG